jgi:small subunit ribosomal protein S16
MLMIRLLRVGKRNQPIFKIVVTEKRNSPKRGRFVEELGFVNPLTKEKKVNKDRASYWLSVGAQPSDTVHNLFIDEKIIEGQKRRKHAKPKGKKKGDETPEAEGEKQSGEEKPAAEEEKKSGAETGETKEAKPAKPAESPDPAGESKEEPKAAEGKKQEEVKEETDEKKPEETPTEEDKEASKKEEVGEEKKREDQTDKQEPAAEQKPEEEAKEEKKEPASPSTPLRTGDKDSAGEGGEEKSSAEAEEG